MFTLLVYEKSDGCSPFRIATASSESEFPYAILIKSGNCNINLKVSNAEIAGARLVIIENQQPNPNEDLITNAYDSISMKISIPALIVSSETGESLQKLLLKTGDVILKFVYPLPKSDVVDVKFILSVKDDKFIDFLKNLETYLMEFENKIAVKFEFFRENKLDDKAKIQIMTNCLSTSNAISVLSAFKPSCLDKKNSSSDCFRQQTSLLEKTEVQNFGVCLKKEGPSIRLVEAKMKILTSGPKSFIFVNHMIFKGTLKAENVFEAICSAFVTSPDVCLYLDNKYTLNKNFHSIKESSRQNKFWIIIINIVILVVLLCFAALAMILIFGKIYQRILNESVSDMVKNSMDAYGNTSVN